MHRVRALFAALAFILLAPEAADAQGDRDIGDRTPDGILGAQILVSDAAPERPGGQLTLDLVRRAEALPWLHGGGFVGIGILGGDPTTTRVQLLIGATAVVGAFPSAERPVGIELRLRAGPWFGAGDWQASEGTSLRAGVFTTAGLHASVGLGPAERRDRLRLTLGLDVSHLFGPSAVTVYAPTIALAYSPRDDF